MQLTTFDHTRHTPPGWQWTATISGSFRKHLRQIRLTIDELHAQGIKVLLPQSTDPIGEDGGFVRLHGDTGSDHQIEVKHLSALYRSDILYVVDPEGYLGSSTTMEVGAAIAAAIPILASDPPSDAMLAGFMNLVPASRVSLFLNDRKTENPPLKLATLQRYIQRMSLVRGFQFESARDLLLLLVEETGELARSIRQDIGLSVDVRQLNRSDASLELADCLVYIVSICNSLGIDIEEALLRKESINRRRQWTRLKDHDQ